MNVRASEVKHRGTYHIACLCLMLLAILIGTPSSGASASRTAVPPSVVLYNGALGTQPDAQGWAYLHQKGDASRSQVGGAAILDTSANATVRAGYFADTARVFGGSTPVPPLDRARGFSVMFTAQMEVEDHNGSDTNQDGVGDRAGFSLIALSSDTMGIELGFWKDQIWAQQGGSGASLFTHAEGTTFDTASALVGYELTIQQDTYTLSAGGKPILSGELRDYRAATGFPDPYETPNFLFFGDDTSAASARSRVSYVAVLLANPTPLPRENIYIPLVAQPK
jgi:hypothetical protein